MSSKSDFLSWDDSDINLDLLLGEYTMSENDSDVENPPPKKSKKDRTCAYSCPECNASYSSVSGFRGHLRKKHSLTNIKLSDHRNATQGKAKQPEPKLSMEYSEMQDLITSCLNKSLQEISDCPFRKDSDRGKKIISLAQVLQNDQATCNALLDTLSPIYIGIITSSESNVNSDMNSNERLFNEFYKTTSDKSIQSKLFTIIYQVQNRDQPIKQFLSILQDSIIKTYINERAALYKKKSGEHSQMSATDQSVLFYIAGYMLSAVKKSNKHKNPEVIGDIISKDETNKKSFIKQYAQWTNKLDRGGLTIPGDNFFLLVREFETCYRKHVDLNCLTSLTLDRSHLTLLLIDDFMVNHYWNSLCSAKDQDILLERFISMFLTIRGHSTARHIKLKLQEKKSTKPLRQALKEKSNQV